MSSNIKTIEKNEKINIANQQHSCQSKAVDKETHSSKYFSLIIRQAKQWKLWNWWYPWDLTFKGTTIPLDSTLIESPQEIQRPESRSNHIHQHSYWDLLPSTLAVILHFYNLRRRPKYHPMSSKFYFDKNIHSSYTYLILVKKNNSLCCCSRATTQLSFL